MLQAVFGTFYRQIKKNTMICHHDVISCCWDLKISNFVKLNHLSKFQISWLFGSNFMEVSARPPKHHYDVISYLSTLAYFVEHDIGYQPLKFQCSRMSGSNFMKGVEPFQCYNEIKSPVLIELNSKKMKGLKQLTLIFCSEIYLVYCLYYVLVNTQHTLNSV